jgi:hypothetical protein
MKNLKILASICFSLLFSGLVLGQDHNEELESFTKEMTEFHNSSEVDKVEIINKHGDINITTWSKKSVKINAIIKVNGTNSKDAEIVLKRISIESSNNNGLLSVQTSFSNKFYSNLPFNINYDVYLPAGHDIDIKNRFGNINLESLTGNIKIDLEYGKLHHKGFELVKKIEGNLTFADAEVGSFSVANLKLSNSNITLQNVENGSLSGEYCNIKLSRAGKLNIDMETGRFQIKQVRDITLNGNFLFSSIDEIYEKGHIEITNGLLIIGTLSDRLKELSVFNKNAPIQLSIPSSLSYNLQGEVTNGQFRHYKAAEFEIIKDFETISFSGTQNDQQKGASIVLFNSNAGINIEDK